MTGLLGGAAVLVVALVVATVLVVRRLVFVATVEGESMAPTLRAGDRLLVRRVPTTALRLGQVVVLDVLDRRGPRHQRQQAGGTQGHTGGYLIKRLAALPGDTTPLPLGHSTIPAGVTVPPGRVVVLGDNTTLSYDSRQAGYFSTTQVIGVASRSLSYGPRNIARSSLVSPPIRGARHDGEVPNNRR